MVVEARDQEGDVLEKRRQHSDPAAGQPAVPTRPAPPSAPLAPGRKGSHSEQARSPGVSFLQGRETPRTPLTGLTVNKEFMTFPLFLVKKTKRTPCEAGCSDTSAPLSGRLTFAPCSPQAWEPVSTNCSLSSQSDCALAVKDKRTSGHRKLTPGVRQGPPGNGRCWAWPLRVQAQGPQGHGPSLSQHALLPAGPGPVNLEHTLTPGVRGSPQHSL